MSGDEYELMPENKLSGMRKELSELKRKAENVDTKTGLPRETMSSIENLNRSINSLLGLFQTATEELKLEERDEELITKQLKPIAEKIDVLLDQNEKIAKAIIAIADMIKETGSYGAKEEPDDSREMKGMEMSRQDMPPQFPPPRAGPMPPPMPPRPGMQTGFPPPPPMGIPEPMPSWDTPGPMPGLDDYKPKKKSILGGLFK